MEISQRRPISAVIISFNERNHIADCLISLSWVDEIVVVDSGSTDGTQDIVRQYTPKVFDILWKGFGSQKQTAVDLASHDIVLNIDCDERVTPELAGEIQDILCKTRISAAYSIPRKTYLGGKEILHSGWSPDRVVRLFNRQKARFSDAIVHEEVLVEGKISRCQYPILHYPFQGISDMLQKMNRYTDLSARMMFESGRRSHLSDFTLHPIFAFLKIYLLRRGFMDGIEGLEIAIANSFHVFSKYIKLRELEQISVKSVKR